MCSSDLVGASAHDPPLLALQGAAALEPGLYGLELRLESEADLPFLGATPGRSWIDRAAGRRAREADPPGSGFLTGDQRRVCESVGRRAGRRALQSVGKAENEADSPQQTSWPSVWSAQVWV